MAARHSDSYISYIFVILVSKQCPECKSVDVRTVPLEKPMQPALSHYFSSLANHTEQILEAAQFQRSQFLIARRRLQDIVNIVMIFIPFSIRSRREECVVKDEFFVLHFSIKSTRT